MLDDSNHDVRSLCFSPWVKFLSPEEVDAGNFALHAVHCLIYTRSRSTSENNAGDTAKAMVLLRSDGYIGLPGGCVEQGETVEAALVRELREEIHFDARVSPADRLHSTHWLEKNWCFHLYTLEVSNSDYAVIERKCADALHFGREVKGTQFTTRTCRGLSILSFLKFSVHQQFQEYPESALIFVCKTMGIMRIPLSVADGKGLPVFLRHTFCGNAKEDIAYALVVTKLLTIQELLRAKELSKDCCT